MDSAFGIDHGDVSKSMFGNNAMARLGSARKATDAALRRTTAAKFKPGAHGKPVAGGAHMKPPRAQTGNAVARLKAAGGTRMNSLTLSSPGARKAAAPGMHRAAGPGMSTGQKAAIGGGAAVAGGAGAYGISQRRKY